MGNIPRPAIRAGSRGATLGIIGFGRIGTATARKAGTIYKRTIAYDPYVSGDLMAGHRVERRERLEDLLAEADVRRDSPRCSTKKPTI